MNNLHWPQMGTARTLEARELKMAKKAKDFMVRDESLPFNTQRWTRFILQRCPELMPRSRKVHVSTWRKEHSNANAPSTTRVVKYCLERLERAFTHLLDDSKAVAKV